MNEQKLLTWPYPQREVYMVSIDPYHGEGTESMEGVSTIRVYRNGKRIEAERCFEPLPLTISKEIQWMAAITGAVNNYVDKNIGMTSDDYRGNIEPGANTPSRTGGEEAQR